MDIFYIIVGATYLFSLLVMRELKSTYRKWGEVPYVARAGVRFGMRALFIGLMLTSPLLTQIGVLACLGGRYLFPLSSARPAR